MENCDILMEVQKILSELIGDEITLSEETMPSEVEEWDSLIHFQLVVALQNEFGIKFAINEIQGWASVGDIVRSIKTKLVK